MAQGELMATRNTAAAIHFLLLLICRRRPSLFFSEDSLSWILNQTFLLIWVSGTVPSGLSHNFSISSLVKPRSGCSFSKDSSSSSSAGEASPFFFLPKSIQILSGGIKFQLILRNHLSKRSNRADTPKM